MASCVEHGEWERKYFACPKCFKDGDVQRPISYPPDREFVDSLAIKPIDAWTGQEKMRLHNIATLATQSARPEVVQREPTAWAIFAADTHEMIDVVLIEPEDPIGMYAEPLFALSPLVRSQEKT